MTKLSIPARHYAVFSHKDHISAIRTTMRAIWSEWLPRSGREIVESPTLERYGPEFDTAHGQWRHRSMAAGEEVIPVPGSGYADFQASRTICDYLAGRRVSPRRAGRRPSPAAERA